MSFLKDFRNNRTWWIVIPCWVYAAIISIFSAIPTPPPGPSSIPYFDKFEHIIEFGILGFLSARVTLTSSSSWLRNASWWLIPILLTAYGYLDELHQLIVPGRSYDLGDWASDSAGGALGTWLTLWWGHNRYGVFNKPQKS